MPNPIKDTAQEKQNESWDQTFNLFAYVPYEFDGGAKTFRKQSALMAKKITVSGSTTYVACAPIGSLQANAVWQAKKINTSGGDTTITWADSGNFSQVATDLTALSYS